MDDKFELYNLRVEVVCPPGKRILCGAKAGDYFTLKGEMLELPPSQGISIYSLCKILLCYSRLKFSGFRVVSLTDSFKNIKQPQCYRFSPPSRESLPKMTGCLQTP